jgi:hypothetical protein
VTAQNGAAAPPGPACCAPPPGAQPAREPRLRRAPVAPVRARPVLRAVHPSGGWRLPVRTPRWHERRHCVRCQWVASANGSPAPAPGAAPAPLPPTPPTPAICSSTLFWNCATGSRSRRWSKAACLPSITTKQVESGAGPGRKMGAPPPAGPMAQRQHGDHTPQCGEPDPTPGTQYPLLLVCLRGENLRRSKDWSLSLHEKISSNSAPGATNQQRFEKK